MSRYFFVQILVKVDDKFKDVKSCREAVLAWVSEEIKSGEIEKKAYRKNVCLNVRDVEIYVKEIGINERK